MNSAIQQIIMKAAQANQLDPELLKAVINKESGGNPNAVSGAGAQGLMQLMPGTAKELGVTDPFNPEQNIMGGSKYLKQQIDNFGSTPLGVAAYNAGPGNVRQAGGVPNFPETKSYVADIMKAITPINSEGPGSLAGITLPQSGQGINLDQIKAMAGMFPDSEKRSNRGALIDSIFSGLASIAGSFNRNKGAELQNLYSTQFQERQKSREEQKQSQIQQLMKLAELANKRPDSTDDLKEYQAAVAQGYGGSFFDYQKQLKQAGALGNPVSQMMDVLKLQSLQKDLANKNLGERIPADKAILLAEGENLPKTLDQLKTSIQENSSAMGPIVGSLRKLNPWDTQAQTLDGTIESVKQVVGKFLEGGVLRKEDVPKYDKILASIKNDPKTALAKIDNIQGDLEQKYNAYLTSLGRAGYNVSEFKPLAGKKNKPSQNSDSSAGTKPSSYQHMSDDDLRKELGL